MKIHYGERFRPSDHVRSDPEYEGSHNLLDLQKTNAEIEQLLEQMREILNRTANALHGGPLEMGMWSWHDLPELAEALYKKANKGFHKASEFKSDAPDGNIPC
jgi:hypothetical protein